MENTLSLISLGGLDPAQSTVSTPGSYNVSIALLTANPAVTFVGPGTYTLTNIAGLLSGYTLEATKGAILNVTGLATVASTATLVIDGASTISLGSGISALSSINASFIGTGGGTLTFPPGLLSLLNATPVVTGFATTDHIDFGTPLTAGTHAVYVAASGGTGGTLSLVNGAGTSLGSVTLLGVYTQSDFAVGTDASGNGEINFACFLESTMILTEDGEVPVELLQVGDGVVTASGTVAAILAVRRRSFPVDSMLDRSFVHPVRIAAGALAENVPTRDLFVSPDHSMYLDDVLVPAQLLVNGSTIAQVTQLGTINYYHVELAPHDIIIAEGAATESYLDIGNRGHFERLNFVTLLNDAEPKTWEDACAPLVLGGVELDRIRDRIASRATVLTNEAVRSRVA